jgi:hypothetical protein
MRLWASYTSQKAHFKMMEVTSRISSKALNSSAMCYWISRSILEFSFLLSPLVPEGDK